MDLILHDSSCLYCRGMYARLAQSCQQALSPGTLHQGGRACFQACFSVYTGSCNQDFNCLTKSNKFSTNSTKISANNLIFMGHFQKCLTGKCKNSILPSELFVMKFYLFNNQLCYNIFQFQ